MYLVDTSIISALAPTRESKRALSTWFADARQSLFLSAITASEVRAGIAKSRRLGHDKKADRLTVWWDAIEHAYEARILPVDLPVAKIAGELIDLSRAFDVGYEDIAIAATAKLHGLCVLTANERHFEPLQVAWRNPLKTLPPLSLK